MNVTLKVVREKCLDCCGQQSKEVTLCTAFKCALWPYRMGSCGKTRRESANEEARKVLYGVEDL